MAILTKIQSGSIVITDIDILGFKGLTLFDILSSYYRGLLGFYVGICNQCNHGHFKQGIRQYTAQDNGKAMRQTSNSIVQAIKYDRSYLLSWAKYQKLSGFSNDDIKRIKLLDLSLLGAKDERKE